MREGCTNVQFCSMYVSGSVSDFVDALADFVIGVELQPMHGQLVAKLQ
jgi:hypothetical protein